MVVCGLLRIYPWFLLTPTDGLVHYKINFVVGIKSEIKTLKNCVTLTLERHQKFFCQMKYKLAIDVLLHII